MIESKVDIKEEAEKDEYPKLMISNLGKVVLFSSKECGTVVHKGDVHDDVGYHTSGWISGAFRDFNGTITLSNK